MLGEIVPRGSVACAANRRWIVTAPERRHAAIAEFDPVQPSCAASGASVASCCCNVGQVAAHGPLSTIAAHEQSGCGGRRNLQTRAHRPRRLTAERDVVRVAAELRDVRVHPAQRGLLIFERVVSGIAFAGIERWARHEAEESVAVIGRHDDDAVAFREHAPFVRRSVALRESAAVEKDQHRALHRHVGRRPHVQVQAIFGGVLRHRRHLRTRRRG